MSCRVVLLLAGGLCHLRADTNDATVDTSFVGPGLPTGTSIQTILPVSGGQIYVQGDGFQSFGPQGQYSNFIRLNADGSLDTAFDPSGGGTFRANPFSMVVQSTGKILIDTVADVAERQTNAPEVVRFNTDGTYNSTFNSLPLIENQLKMLVQSTDQVVLVGSVSENFGNGSYVSGSIARLGVDGALDTSFPVTQFYESGGDTSFPQHAALQTDDKILVGGSFYYFGAATGSPTRNGLLRLNADGTFDPTFDLGDSAAPVQRSISVIAVQPDGNILIGGDLELAGATVGVLRVTPTGAVDTTFGVGTFAASTDNPYAVPSIGSIFVQADGKIVVGGIFASYNGVARNNLLRLNGDGSLDMAFDPGSGSSGSDAGGYISALAVDGNGHLLVGGDFTAFNGSAYTSLVRLGGRGGGGTTTNGVTTVPGTSNPWLAPPGATDNSGDSTPAESPAFVTGATLTPGTTLTFGATGTIFYEAATPSDPPVGEVGTSLTHGAENGLSGITAPIDALVGVFIDDSPADPTNASAPASLDFTGSVNGVPGGVDYATLQPALRQVFFIGDGMTSGGVSRQVTVPAGATHLVLGTLDGSGWYDNVGAFYVAVGVGTGSTGGGGTTLTATTFDVDGYPDNGAAAPPAIAPGAPITFTATQGGTASPGLFVRVQAAPFPADGNIHDIPEGSWTDLTDTTNGGNGYLANTGGVNYSLTTTQYPVGEVVAFRAISAASGQTDQISAPVGPFDFTSTSNPTPTPTPAPATGLTITQTASTADDPRASVAIVGDQITYKFYVTNPGPATLTNVKITNVLPPTLQFQSADNGYVLTGGNVVTYTFPQLSPNPGNPLTITLVASVTSSAIVGKTIVNNGYSVASDSTGIVQGVVPGGTTIIPALEVVLVGGSTPVIPGQSITYTLNVTNRSPGKIKGITVTVPVPGPANVLAYGFVDASGALLSAPQTTTGTVSLNGGNLVFTLDALKPKKAEHLEFTVVVPLDVNPTTAIVQAGAQVTTKTSVGGVNQFTLPDTTTPLTGQGPAYKPQISFAKIPIEEVGLLQLFGAQPKLEKNLLKAVGAAVLDPALATEIKLIYPGLSTLKVATAGLVDLVNALNPDVGYDDTTVTNSGFYAVTVTAPTASTPTYLAFVLPYTNGGSATVADAVITDRVPDGTTIYDQSGAYNESVILNKKLAKPVTGGNLEILDGGKTLRFHVGDLAPGETGFVIYKVRVLGPGESGAPSDGDVLTTSGSVLSSSALSRTYIGQPDGGDITVVGRYDYYLESTAYSIVPGQGYTYEIYYQNTGSRKSKILEIDDPIPAGLQYVGCELLDGGHHSLPGTGIPDGAVTGAPAGSTSGTVVFHPALFTSKGKVTPGDGGFIRVFFAPVGTPASSYAHTPSIPAGSFALTSAARPGGTARATAASGPVRRDASTPRTTAVSTTVPDDPARGKVFISLALPMAMVEGVDSEVFVALGSLNDAAIDDNVVESLVVTLPKGVDYKAGELGPDQAEFQATKQADGTTRVSIDFISQLPGHSAALAKFLVTPETGSASQAPTVFPGGGVDFIPGQSLSLNTGPVNVRILTADEASALSTMQAQVAGVVLQKVGASNPQFNAFTQHISLASRTVVVSGASAYSATSGALIVPLQGSPDNVLVLGPVGTLHVGQSKFVATANIDFLVATGPSTTITYEPGTGIAGIALEEQSINKLIGDIVNAVAGNGVAMGAITILNGRGSQIISQDGNGIISQDGNGLTGMGANQLVKSPDDVGAAGLSNVNAVISNDGGTAIGENSSGLISPNRVVSNDGGSLVASQGGQILHGSGAAGVIGENSSGAIGENSSGLVGTSDNSMVADATAGGNFNQVSSLVGGSTGTFSSSSIAVSVGPASRNGVTTPKRKAGAVLPASSTMPQTTP